MTEIKFRAGDKVEVTIPIVKELDAFQLVMKMCEKANEEGFNVEWNSVSFSLRDKTLFIRPVGLLKRIKNFITN